MDVIDLLIDHPTASEGFSLEAFLPDLVTFLRYRKRESLACFHDCFAALLFRSRQNSMMRPSRGLEMTWK